MKKLILLVALIASSFHGNAQAYGQQLDYNPAVGVFFFWFNMNTYVPYKVDYGGDSTLDYTEYVVYGCLDSDHVDVPKDYVVMATKSGAIYSAPVSSLFSQTMTPIASGGRNFNTAYRLSTTNSSQINISVQVSCTLSLTAGQSGQVFLEYSANGSSGWTFAGELAASNTGTLIIGLNTAQASGGQLSSPLPPGYYWRARTNGTGTFTFLGGSEVVN